MKFLVHVNDGSMGLGALGNARVLSTISVEADSEAEARKQAKATTGKTVYSCEQVFRFAITLRGHEDKRKRETFYINATSERDALRALSYNPRSWQFAHFSLSKARQAETVVKITKENA